MEVSGQLHFRPIYPWGKDHRYPLDGRLGGPQSQSGRGCEEKNPSSYREMNPSRPARSIVTTGVHMDCNRILFLCGSRKSINVLLILSCPYLSGNKRRRGNCIVRSFIICTLYQMLLGWSYQGEGDGWDMRQAWERREILVKVWSEIHLGDLGIDQRIKLVWILEKQSVRKRFIWLKISSSS